MLLGTFQYFALRKKKVSKEFQSLNKIEFKVKVSIILWFI